MIQYLKRAFWAGPSLPGLGRLPVNAMATLGFGILGFGHPAFWLLGAGLETAYLAFVATDRRFQKWVDRQLKPPAEPREAAESRDALIQKLDPESRRRLGDLIAKRSRILQAGQDTQGPAFALESTREALGRLEWTYLKLLVARSYLESSKAPASAAGLERQIAELAREVAAGEGSLTLKSSREARLDLLRQRLQNLERRAETLQEIDSDLARIEAQVDLALENASLQRGGAVVAANLELASEILRDGLYFGDSEPDVLALDQAYSAPPLPSRDRA
jgi:hypothetical protein